MTPSKGSKALGDLFRAARIANGITQKTAAQWLGISQPTLSEIEGGYYGSYVRKLERFAHAYGYTMKITLIPFDPQRDVLDHLT